MQGVSAGDWGWCSQAGGSRGLCSSSPTLGCRALPSGRGPCPPGKGTQVASAGSPAGRARPGSQTLRVWAELGLRPVDDSLELQAQVGVLPPKPGYTAQSLHSRNPLLRGTEGDWRPISTSRDPKRRTTGVRAGPGWGKQQPRARTSALGRVKARLPLLLSRASGDPDVGACGRPRMPGGGELVAEWRRAHLAGQGCYCTSSGGHRAGPGGHSSPRPRALLAAPSSIHSASAHLGAMGLSLGLAPRCPPPKTQRHPFCQTLPAPHCPCQDEGRPPPLLLLVLLVLTHTLSYVAYPLTAPGRVAECGGFVGWVPRPSAS